MRGLANPPEPLRLLKGLVVQIQTLSTIQSRGFRTSRRIAPNPRVHARFAISADLENVPDGLNRSKSTNPIRAGFR